MKRVKLAVDRREQTGKGPARRLRAAEKVPAVFYGKKSGSIPITVDVTVFRKLLEREGSNMLLDLEIRENGNSMVKTAFMKDRQVDPLSGELVHIDFIEIFKDVAIEVTVHIEYVGDPKGVDDGGVFQASQRELLVSCLPDDIPESIVVEVSHLEIGQSIQIADLTLPQGVTPVQDESVSVASVLAPSRAAEGEEEAGEALEEGVEGEAPAAEKTGEESSE